MVGLATCISKKTGPGPADSGQLSNPHKSMQNSVHAKRDTLTAQSTGFGVNEPLSNPNWRIRRSHDGQENFRALVPKHLEPPSLTTPQLVPSASRKLSPFQSYSRAKQPSFEESHRKTAVESQLAEEPLGYTDNTRMAGGAGSSLPESNPPGNDLFEVAEYKDLHGQGIEHTLGLFSVVAARETGQADKRCTLSSLTSEDDNLENRVFQMLYRKHTLTPDENQGHQLIAALEATEPTPRKVSHLSSHSSNTSQNSRCLLDQSSFPVHTRREDVRQCRLNSKDSGYSQSSASREDFSNDTDEEFVVIPSPHNRSFKQKEMAFQKLIRRLNGGSSRRKQFDESIDSGYEHEFLLPQEQQSQFHNRSPVIETRKPIHGTGRRVNTASDYTINYWPMPDSNLRDCSADSTRGDVPDTKYNSLNPKAREFLSFSQRPPDLPSKAPAPVLVLSETSNEYVSPCEPSDGLGLATEPRLRELATSNHSFPSSRQMPELYSNSSRASLLFPPLHTSNTAMLGLIPVIQDAYEPLLGQPGIWPASQIVPNITDIGTAPQLPQNSTLNSLAPLSSRVNIAGPSISNASPSTPTTKPLARRVPKPKEPNPRDQQAYEAWVEWRKATEPGYALACKLRQQRRAQRNAPSGK